ncbi:MULTISPECIES: NAD-glutamate dehydrogenase [unclassified Azospirillum]|uniref:NAD-glutamate dehydrogenase n=1 Tax=unclassified Azospirillum TaxID=2630922 RepID=UPI000B6D15A8|nr:MULTISPECIES: NAD-glutamate dehydrogenase [unclassified Azospirillum]SNR90233.1 glutamate dehydrogenase (NAD) [Azospirillum sp. RU38E]SNS06217.1 glutamate dehydrogenase (NAD) [Azospirillum sp. RU37A]
MAYKLEQRKSELVEQVVAKLRARLPKEKAALAETFVRQFYRNVSAEDMLRSSADELYGAALAIWQFGCTRHPGETLVRVMNPRVDADGWHAHHTVVEIVNDDMPFLVDSVSAELNRHGLTVHLVVHPVLRLTRGADGKIATLFEPDAAPADAIAESVMHIEVDQIAGAAELEALRSGILKVLGDVRAAVVDFTTMRERLAETLLDSSTGRPPLPAAEIDEGLSFLRWMDEEHFIFLGVREYRFGQDNGEATLEIQRGQGLGVLRDDDVSVFDGLRHFSTLPPEVRSFVRQQRFLMVTKANKDSTVHRRAPLDAVMVKLFNEQGEEIGERLFAGLFTSTAYNRSARDIPYLRQKVNRLMDRTGFDPRGHDGKALLHILETFPRDELFQISDDELHDIALGVLQLQDRQRVALFVRKDPFNRFVSALIYVPRDRYDTDLRRRLQGLIEKAYGGTTSQAHVTLSESVLARVHLIIQTNGAPPDVDVVELETQLIEAARGWRDRLSQALVEEKGEAAGLALARKYLQALPASYQEAYGPDEAVVDIARIEQALATGRLALNLHRPVEAESHQLYFKVYQSGSPVELSKVLPMLEHLGLRILAEGGPYEVEVPDQPANIFIQDFDMLTTDGRAVELEKIKAAFEDAFLRVWTGEAQSDGLNRLVLAGGLSWREVVVFRAYAKYLKQAKFDLTQEYIENTLAAHAAIARRLIDLFRVSHDPAFLAQFGRDAVDVKRKGLILEIDHALDGVSNLDEDRILRRMLNLIRSTLRTNYFQKGADGAPKPYVSFKLDSTAIDELPLPRPWREIWVYSPRVEAIHLRGGKVARGGIRWSDRKEDFRTEILGLIKAQIVKNAVIVPVGSKGGFVVKNPPPPTAGREALMAEVVECYKTMMRGLLDITDNLKKGEVIPPIDVVRLDSDDPYLVVAADKGTATFSDIANGVSRDYGFWLDDAFASGGSAGYDHKGMGITARGAWEAVKRHFRERGKDIQQEDFSVVGVGDMSGDVFGNGMLLSRHIRLIAAFDHRHIFIDPNPDAATSWAERKRLFDLGRSSWADYDASLLSPGGGIFDRSAKFIQLSPEIRQALDIPNERLTPAALMQAILKARVELLWLGGIGTYVKSHAESNADAGDKANDAIRINGRDLRVKVVGEGANLGFTQRGRVEAAQAGIAINTDAIDNSAGVDTSDHEVNIKILLRDVMDKGGMTREQRDKLLAEMTDEVAALVLTDNYKQTQALTIAQANAADTLEDQTRFARSMEKAGKLSRAIEFLPDDEEVAARVANRQGLTRPELAVLLAYAKIDLYDQLLASGLPDDTAVLGDLVRYFPKALQDRFPDAVAGHQLRREIICTAVTNGMVNRVGPTFTWEMVEQTGRGADDVARAYLVVRDAFGLRALWDAVEALDAKAPARAQTEMMLYTGHLMRRAVPWVLAHGAYPLDIQAEIARLAPVVAELAGDLAGLLSPAALKWVAEHAGRWSEQQVPGDLASHIAQLPALAAATDIAAVTVETGKPAPDVAALYFQLGDRLGLDTLRARTLDVKADNHWQRQAVAAILDDLFSLQARLTARVLAQPGSNPLEVWIAQRQGPLDRINSLLTELRAASSVDIAMLAVASRQLRGLLAG